MECEYPLDARQKSELLRLARRTIEAELNNAPPPALETDDPALLQPAGAFVTLRYRPDSDQPEQLRGCIGTLEENSPLIEAVSRMAVAAATGDPRFDRVVYDELPSLYVEISVLLPRHEVAPDEVEVGRHGLLISKGHYRGVLLPQVATDYGWDRHTFLEQTCRKAGLPTDAWQEAETCIEAFSAIVFSELEVDAEPGPR